MIEWLIVCSRLFLDERFPFEGPWQNRNPESIAMTLDVRHGVIIAITHVQYDVFQKALYLFYF